MFEKRFWNPHMRLFTIVDNLVSRIGPRKVWCGRGYVWGMCEGSLFKREQTTLIKTSFMLQQHLMWWFSLTKSKTSAALHTVVTVHTFKLPTGCAVWKVSGIPARKGSGWSRPNRRYHHFIKDIVTIKFVPTQLTLVRVMMTFDNNFKTTSSPPPPPPPTPFSKSMHDHSYVYVKIRLLSCR